MELQLLANGCIRPPGAATVSYYANWEFVKLLTLLHDTSHVICSLLYVSVNTIHSFFEEKKHQQKNAATETIVNTYHHK